MSYSSNAVLMNRRIADESHLESIIDTPEDTNSDTLQANLEDLQARRTASRLRAACAESTLDPLNKTLNRIVTPTLS